MESSRKPDSAGLGRTSLTFDPLHSQNHIQTDSFLAAARLVRRGFPEEGKKRRWQFSPRQPAPPAPSKSTPSQDSSPAEVRLESRQSPVSSSRKTTSEDEASEKRPEQEEPEPDRHRRTQGALVYVWTSGCRSTFRQSRRFRAPILPVIAEM